MSPLLRPTMLKVDNIEGIMPFFVSIEFLHVCAWLGIVENLDVDGLLERPFTTEAVMGYSQPEGISSITIQFQRRLIRQRQ